MLKVCVLVLIKKDNQTGMKGWQPFLHKINWLDLIYILTLYYKVFTKCMQVMQHIRICSRDINQIGSRGQQPFFFINPTKYYHNTSTCIELILTNKFHITGIP